MLSAFERSFVCGSRINPRRGIQLNERVSLQRADEILSSVAVVQDWPTPHTFRPCVPARLGVAAE